MATPTPTPTPPIVASLSWQHDTVFAAEGSGDTRLVVDISQEKGGSGVGFTPMQLLLHALASCLAVTVVQILKKQRLRLASYQIEARGERADAPPHPYRHIVVEHRFRGDGLTHDSLERLVALVEDRYCSVAATLPPGLIEHRIVVLPGETDGTHAGDAPPL